MIYITRKTLHILWSEPFDGQPLLVLDPFLILLMVLVGMMRKTIFIFHESKAQWTYWNDTVCLFACKLIQRVSWWSNMWFINFERNLFGSTANYVLRIGKLNWLSSGVTIFSNQIECVRWERFKRSISKYL